MSDPRQIRVVVGEDQSFVREGIVRVLQEGGFDVAGTTADARDLVRMAGVHVDLAPKSLEFDDRPGRVRDRIVELMRKWLKNLEYAAREAQLVGEIKKEVDVRQLAFEIQALAMGANWSSRLFRDQSAFRLVRGAILRRIVQDTAPVQSRE